MAADHHIETIKSHCENIEMIIKGYQWGKEAGECFAEIEKSINVIKMRVAYLTEEAAA